MLLHLLCVIAKLLLGVSAFADVLDPAIEPTPAILVEHALIGDLHPGRGSVAAAKAQLVTRCSLGRDVADDAVVTGAIVTHHQAPEGAQRDDVVLVVSRDGLDRPPRPIEHEAMTLGLDAGIGDVRHQHGQVAKMRLAALERLIGATLAHDAPGRVGEQLQALHVQVGIVVGLVAHAGEHACQTAVMDRKADEALQGYMCRR